MRSSTPHRTICPRCWCEGASTPLWQSNLPRLGGGDRRWTSARKVCRAAREQQRWSTSCWSMGGAPRAGGLLVGPDDRAVPFFSSSLRVSRATSGLLGGAELGGGRVAARQAAPPLMVHVCACVYVCSLVATWTPFGPSLCTPSFLFFCGCPIPFPSSWLPPCPWLVCAPVRVGGWVVLCVCGASRLVRCVWLVCDAWCTSAVSVLLAC